MGDNFFNHLADVCHRLLLDNDDLMRYLRDGRKMTDRTIKTYKLGAFPTDLRDLYSKHDMNPKELREQGIIINADYSSFKLYPIVIPVRDLSGKCIAIGCRTLLSEEKRKERGIPKYRNSVYKKTSHLFGLDTAIEAIRQLDKVFVVEGYFDAIQAQQHGMSNVVATCGTMFSEKQLITLARYTENICLLFDNDDPGRRSAKKIMDKFRNFDGSIKLIYAFTPNGHKDLDEYLSNGGDMKYFDRIKDPEIKSLW